MKKRLIMCLMLVCVLAFTFGLTACSGEKHELQYELSSDGSYYVVTGLKSKGIPSSSDPEYITVTIPSEYNGKPVKRIKSLQHPKIKSLVIPNSVNYIDESAVGLRLESLTFGDYSGVELTTHDEKIQPYSIYIGENAFCPIYTSDFKLKPVEIPANAYLEKWSFRYAELTSVTFAGNIAVKTDGSYVFNAFLGCKLSSIELPEATADYVVGEPSDIKSLSYVIAPTCAILKSWNLFEDNNNELFPPTVFYKGNIGFPRGTDSSALCGPSGNRKTFGTFVYLYSETQANMSWRYVDGIPTEW